MAGKRTEMRRKTQAQREQRGPFVVSDKRGMPMTKESIAATLAKKDEPVVPVDVPEEARLDMPEVEDDH